MRLIATLFLMGYIGSLNAAPIMQANVEGVRILLYSDPCLMKDKVSNLPYRATWTENGKTFEGCWAGNQGQVVGYFSDMSVALMPAQIFSKVTGV
jgi:hypothetical protein